MTITQGSTGQNTLMKKGLPSGATDLSQYLNAAALGAGSTAALLTRASTTGKTIYIQQITSSMFDTTTNLPAAHLITIVQATTKYAYVSMADQSQLIYDYPIAIPGNTGDNFVVNIINRGANAGNGYVWISAYEV